VKIDQINGDLSFWCPRCHECILGASKGGFLCRGCGHQYSVVNDVPVLINDENSVFAESDFSREISYEGASYGSNYDRSSGLRLIYRRAVHVLTEFGVKSDNFDVHEAIKEVCESIHRPKILVIGAGVIRYSQNADFVYTDVAFSSGLNAIVDAHDLPYGDGEFDMVLALAVLEHVVDPPRVVSEIWRVLKSTGKVFAVTPFLQPVHMGAYDFTRYTLLGHRRLFRRFHEDRSGMAVGPAAVAGLSLRSLLLSFSNNKTYRRVANLVGIVVSMPIKALDYFTRNSRSSLDGAGGVFFFGQKQIAVLSDRELIKLYRGGFE
jgi:SAM-dependent methyltransferase